ncbi:hypothetical protein ACOMHN_023300 [Nucella lapillus]
MRSIKFIPRCTKSRNSLRQQKWFATFTDVKRNAPITEDTPTGTLQPHCTLYSPTAPTLYSPTTVLLHNPTPQPSTAPLHQPSTVLLQSYSTTLLHNPLQPHCTNPLQSYYSPTPQPYSTTLYSPTAPTLYSPTIVLLLQPYSTTLCSPTAPTGTLYSNTLTTNLLLEEVCSISHTLSMPKAGPYSTYVLTSSPRTTSTHLPHPNAVNAHGLTLLHICLAAVRQLTCSSCHLDGKHYMKGKKLILRGPFGGPGEEEGQVNEANGITTFAGKGVAIADTNNCRIQFGDLQHARGMYHRMSSFSTRWGHYPNKVACVGSNRFVPNGRDRYRMEFTFRCRADFPVHQGRVLVVDNQITTYHYSSTELAAMGHAGLTDYPVKAGRPLTYFRTVTKQEDCLDIALVEDGRDTTFVITFADYRLRTYPRLCFWLLQPLISRATREDRVGWRRIAASSSLMSPLRPSGQENE